MRRASRVVASGVLFVAALTTAVTGQAPSTAWVEVMHNLHDPNPAARLRAVEALALGDYAPAADAVSPLVVDPDRRVRFAAIDAEVRFFLAEPASDGSAPDSLAGSSRSRAQDAFDAGPLARGAGVVPPGLLDNLLKATGDTNARIRFDALHAVGFIAEPPIARSAVDTLAAGLDSNDPVFRAATARVLGRLRAEGVGDKLIAALNDRDVREQRCATDALGRVRETRAVTSLLERFAYFGHGDLAAETLLAIARIGDRSALDVFTAHVSDADPDIRRAAIEGLGRTGSRDALPTIAAHRQKDSSASVRLAAVFAGGLLADADVPAIVAALGDRETYAQALDYLLELGPAAAPAVQTTLRETRDVHVRGDLIHLLGFIGDKASVPYIEPFLSDRNDRVARAAIDTIARLSRS